MKLPKATRLRIERYIYGINWRKVDKDAQEKITSIIISYRNFYYLSIPQVDVLQSAYEASKKLKHPKKPKKRNQSKHKNVLSGKLAHQKEMRLRANKRRSWLDKQLAKETRISRKIVRKENQAKRAQTMALKQARQANEAQQAQGESR